MDALNVKVNDKIEMNNRTFQVIKISGDKLMCTVIDEEITETKEVDLNDKFLIQKSLF